MNYDDYEDDYEQEEQEESPVREDKIFNNSYYNGDKLKDSEEYEFSRKISVSSDYSDSYLKDLYDYEEQLESKFILDIIFEFLQKDPELSKYVKSISEETGTAKVKFSKEDINIVFNRVHENLDAASHGISFYSPIYIIEAISSITSLEYKKIFDSLETDTQEMLLIELNKKYKFLDGKMHKKRIH
ncbi:hypothetical protein UFOVP699_58 [uncultured Caudovirales phage]|uniref:Uncharacterized protein n=1 Tax=uncultured Caudovirales phage TaxID=2100421 RepID=A0A6J5NPJ8_9CAUD|nr:hypothetical protein UFOVP699_58 [uncultured Caudovirales phage]